MVHGNFKSIWDQYRYDIYYDRGGRSFFDTEQIGGFKDSKLKLHSIWEHVTRKTKMIFYKLCLILSLQEWLEAPWGLNIKMIWNRDSNQNRFPRPLSCHLRQFTNMEKLEFWRLLWRIFISNAFKLTKNLILIQRALIQFWQIPSLYMVHITTRRSLRLILHRETGKSASLSVSYLMYQLDKVDVIVRLLGIF